MTTRKRRVTLERAALCWCALGAAAFANAQGTTDKTGTGGDAAVVTLPEITVVAQKAPTTAQRLPVSVTAVTRNTIEDADIRMLKDAAAYAPNVSFTEFSSRALSVPYFRGIGSSPANPAVTACYDGVPQLHAYSANRELLDVEQIEFIRGPQAALYGRNTLGGAINVTSRLPPDVWRGDLEGGYGNYDSADTRFSTSGPLVPNRLGLSLAGGYSTRDGYTHNDVTGHDVDDRQASFGKLQLRWTPSEAWSVRLIVDGERDRDGDYALGDLDAIRHHPHHVQRDFEGYADRDILAPTLLIERQGDDVDLALITGLVRWKQRELTDMDYSPVPAVRREAEREDTQFTQEIRLASAKDSPWSLSDDFRLKWQTGLFFFTQRYREEALNEYAPYVLSPYLDYPITQTSPEARLNDIGLGAYAQTTLMAWETLDFGAGLRGDYEHKDADLQTFYTPFIGAPDTAIDRDRDFSQVSPQFSLAWHITPDKTAYATASRGYTAGGFNPVSPVGRETYDEETSWSYETGLKTSWYDDRLTLNVAAFYISWKDLQLNLPVAQGYYVANAGDADSKGVELELTARPLPGWDIFGGIGYADTRFLSGASSIRTDAYGVNSTVDVGGNDLIYAPEFTANAGTQVTWQLSAQTKIFARAEVVAYGRYYYNPANTESQDAYCLANFRVGVRGNHWFAETWVKNAFDKDYVPVAFEFPNGQSGFLGESGAPLTCGLRTGVDF